MKRKNLWKRLISLMLVVMVSMSGSPVTAFAADDAKVAYNAIINEMVRFKPSASPTEQEILDFAKKALPAGSTVTLKIKDFEIIPAPEMKPGGNPTYATLKAKIVVGNKFQVIIDKLIPKEKTDNEKKLDEDWKAMCKVLDQVTITNRTTKEKLLNVALSVQKNGTTAEWSSFNKVDATYEKKGSILGYMTLTLNGMSKEILFQEEIPMLENIVKTKPLNSTMDLFSLKESMPILAYGKFKEGAASLTQKWLGFPKGATVYLADNRNTCSGLFVYRAYYEGRAHTVDSKDVTDMKDVSWKSSWIQSSVYKDKNGRIDIKKVKVEKSTVVGSVSDPYHYYYIYAKPSIESKYVIGAVSAGATIDVVKEKYNSKWAKVMCGVENTTVFGYIKRADLNTTDSYLAGVNRKYQQSVKLAKKAKIAYSGILKNYDKTLTKKEFCRLAVNWYKATGHKLPKQSKKSPYTDTKDSYVIMAHQLGIWKSTSNKKFNPNKKISENEYKTRMKSLVRIAGESENVYKLGGGNAYLGDDITRQEAIHFFYLAYQATRDTDYLAANYYDNNEVEYTISPADNQNLCLDNWWSMDPRTTIVLQKKAGNKNQRFCMRKINGFLTIINKCSTYTLTGTGEGLAYQYDRGYESQKMTIKYNDDGTVCIVNGDGMYLDIQYGEAVNDANLTFAPKSGKSSQKFVFKYAW